MPPSPPRPIAWSLGLGLFLAVGTVSSCSLLVDAALSDKGTGTGGASGSGASAPGSVASAGSSGTGTSTAASAGSSTGSSSEAASSSSGGGVPCPANMMCMLPNAMASCSQGQCIVTSCMAGFADCDMMPADGCEVHLKSDPQHCGSCSNACQPGYMCTGGTCK
jgi:hypothetical protein